MFENYVFYMLQNLKNIFVNYLEQNGINFETCIRSMDQNLKLLHNYKIEAVIFIINVHTKKKEYF